MPAYFELGMHRNGRYFFTARNSVGTLLATSTCFHTRQGALDAMRSIVKSCKGGHAVCYDRTLRAWHAVLPRQFPG